MKPSDFDSVIDFPRAVSVVYVLFCSTKDEASTKPFYVGQTANFHGRMTDYFRGTFAAATDFKVAVRYLLKNGMRVTVGYNECADRTSALKEESRIIKDIRSQNIHLLNDLGSYDYRVAIKESERTRLHTFCDDYLLR